MTFDRLVRATLGVAVFAMALRVSVDTDTWWHLRAGDTIVQEGHVLTQDRFSLTRQGEEWHYPGWLAEVMMSRVFEAGGYAGMNLATAAVVLAAWALVWTALEGPTLLRAFVVVLAATTSAVYWSARPHLLTFLLTAGFIALTLRALRGRRGALYGCIPLMALWANLHGGFAVGLLVLLLAAAGQLLDGAMDRVGLRRETGELSSGGVRPLDWLAAIAGCVAAVSLNPLGPSMILYPLQTASIGVLRMYIQEWQSPDFHQLEVLPFLLLLLGTFAAMALSPRRPRGYELLWTAGFGALAFLAARNIALFALAAAPVLSRHAAAWLGQLRLERARGREVSPAVARALNWVLFALVVLAAGVKAVRPLSDSFNRETLRSIVPVAAGEYLLDERPPGPLFNSYNWGGYVVWALYPHYLSFVDGRTDLFGDVILEQYLLAWRADPGWEEVFDRWGIRLALLEPQAPLTRALEAAGWQNVYQDDLAVVLVSPGRP